MPRSIALATCVFAFALAAAAPARADDAALSRARALYDEAGELEAQGRWPEAQARLREALAIRETPNLRFALGWALENGGRREEARQQYGTARELAERSDNTEVARLASDRLRALAPRLARPGSDAAPPAAAPAGATGTVLPWVLVVAGGSLVAAGAVLVGMSAADASERDRATASWCAATACVDGATATRPETPSSVALRNEATAAASRGNTKEAVGFTLGGVGLAAAGVGAFLLGSPRGKTESSVRIQAAVLPGAAAASATFRF